ncbi:DNA mismatch repair protein MutS, core [Artemisia annua]|uniref:DNA mismatch repair protein MutS, core n=1 Tax=Artemisia annua TaxID=35608 RepID=A0A2U1L9P1_ARTAN|nr:DNA mismatch repair protein MutS, core [Artemisia annua]
MTKKLNVNAKCFFKRVVRPWLGLKMLDLNDVIVAQLKWEQDRNATKGARAARLNRNKLMREQKRATLLKEKRASSGTASAPRVIVLFDLLASTNVSSLAHGLLSVLSNESNGTPLPAVASSEYRLRAMVGAGTNPLEGAALGMSLLECFAEAGALLTMATTQHGELKTLKYSNDTFENACMEFDEVNLKPTYRILVEGGSERLGYEKDADYYTVYDGWSMFIMHITILPTQNWKMHLKN